MSPSLSDSDKFLSERMQGRGETKVAHGAQYENQGEQDACAGQSLVIAKVSECKCLWVSRQRLRFIPDSCTLVMI
jgi:hypothetical protein